MRVLIAVWRLARAVLHLMHGIVVIKLRFGAYSQAQREARIQWWSAKLLRLLGLELEVRGDLPAHMVRTLIVANHISWLDIAAIHAVLPQARFVSKADVLKWPLIGSLVAGAGTLFIERERKRDAIRVVHHMAEALDQGQAVAVFPEGTVGDGHELLPFHANLLQAAVTTKARLLPVALRYPDVEHAVSPVVLYTGTINLAHSVWRIAGARGLRVIVTVLPPMDIAGLDRRAAAESVQRVIADAAS